MRREDAARKHGLTVIARSPVRGWSSPLGADPTGRRSAYARSAPRRSGAGFAREYGPWRPVVANLPKDFWTNAELVPAVAKEAISLRVDVDVLTWFREQGPRYQSRMNAVLRAYMRAKASTAKKRL